MTPTTLKAFRAQAELTQQQAADLFGVSLRCWKYWEAGERPIPAIAERLWQVLTLHGSGRNRVIDADLTVPVKSCR